MMSCSFLYLREEGIKVILHNKKLFKFMSLKFL